MVEKVNQNMENIYLRIEMIRLIYDLYYANKISKKIAQQLLDQYHRSKERRRVY